MSKSNFWSLSLWEKILVLFGLVFLLIYVAILLMIKDSNPTAFFIMLILGLGVIAFLYISFTSKRRRRKKILSTSFPQAWREILEDRVRFYQRLNDTQKQQFEKEVQIFLGEKKITGVKTEVDDTLRVLIAASAIIPIFGFEEWEYGNLDEVLVYPKAFGRDFLNSEEGGNALGMVGTGPLDQKMILSKPAVLNGFLRKGDGHNTAIHEFVHLIDGADGEFDGIPALMDQKYVLPWMEMIHREMNRIDRRKSKLRQYGATNKQEFFAVASEFFFERPQDLKRHHPKLYTMLSQIFHQDMRHQILPSAWKRAKKT